MAILLVGQGSERFAAPGILLRQHAERLRACGAFAEVEAGCLAGEPSLAGALRRLTDPVVHIVPFFMCDGFLVRELMPKLLHAAEADQAREFRIHPAVGEHVGLAELIIRRVRRACHARGLDPASVHVHLIGHGSPLYPASAQATRRHAASVIASRAFAGVQVAFLDQAPFISPDLLRQLPSPAAVLSLFATEGLHGGEDIPNMMAAARAMCPDDSEGLLDCGIIGEEPDMAKLVLDQIRHAKS